MGRVHPGCNLVPGVPAFTYAGGTPSADGRRLRKATHGVSGGAPRLGTNSMRADTYDPESELKPEVLLLDHHELPSHSN